MGVVVEGVFVAASVFRNAAVSCSLQLRPVCWQTIEVAHPTELCNFASSVQPRLTLSALTPSDAFERRLVSKRYVALVAGELEGSGAITTPLDGKVRRRNYALHSLRFFLRDTACPICSLARTICGTISVVRG